MDSHICTDSWQIDPLCLSKMQFFSCFSHFIPIKRQYDENSNFSANKPNIICVTVKKVCVKERVWWKRERVRVYVCERVRVYVWERVYVCVWERECVCERERECARESVWKRVRERPDVEKRFMTSVARERERDANKQGLCGVFPQTVKKFINSNLIKIKLKQ